MLPIIALQLPIIHRPILAALAYDAEKKQIYVPGGREGKSKLVILKEFGVQSPEDQTKTASIKLK